MLLQFTSIFLLLLVNLTLHARMQIFGAAYLGPLGHYFHILLDKIFKGKKDPKTVGKKVFGTYSILLSSYNHLLYYR